MVFKSWSITERRRARGFTLVEYMFAVAIGVVVLGVGTVLWGYASKTCAALLNYSDLSMTSKAASDRVSQEIRNAIAVQSFSSNQIILTDPNGTNVSFTYFPAAGKLYKIKGGQAPKLLLSGCKSFQFKVYSRVPTSGSDVLTETASTATAKVVQMRWSAGRKLTGDRDNVESLVSANVVIRTK
jgi:prepilin-type N-terminal cleavage/methylation domain-containing protein